MRIGEKELSRLLLLILIWVSVFIILDLLGILAGDIPDSLLKWDAANRWLYFFRTFWDISCITVLSIAGLTAWRQLPGGEIKVKMLRFDRNRAIGLIALMLAARILVAPFLAHGGDMTCYLLAGYNVANGRDTYEMRLSEYDGPHIPRIVGGGDRFIVDYPPFWSLLLGFSYILSETLFKNNLFAYIFSIKLWIIAADLALAYVMYTILKEEQTDLEGYSIATFYFLCPFPLLIGAIWGQMDVIYSLTTLLAAVLLVRKRYLQSGFLLGLGFGLKYYPVILAPIFFYATRQRRDKIKFLAGLVTMMALTLTLPYLFWGSAGATNFIATMQNLSNDRGTLLSVPYAIEIICEVVRAQGSLIRAWFRLKENSIVNKSWILPLLWIYYRWKEQVQSKPHEIKLKDLLKPSIGALIIFFAFRFWVTEQMLMVLFTFSLVLVYLENGKGWNYIQLLWTTLILWSFINLRLGHHLLLPIWDHVDIWANFITYQGSRYVFWMRSVTGTVLSLYLVFYNLQFLRTVIKSWESHSSE